MSCCDFVLPLTCRFGHPTLAPCAAVTPVIFPREAIARRIRIGEPVAEFATDLATWRPPTARPWCGSLRTASAISMS